MTEKLEQKLIHEKEYLIGSEAERMFYCKGHFRNTHYFINWHMKVRGKIKLISIESKDILLNENNIEDKSRKYLGRVIKYTPYTSLKNIFHRADKIVSGESRGDAAEYELGKIEENLLYVELREVLEEKDDSK